MNTYDYNHEVGKRKVSKDIKFKFKARVNLPKKVYKSTDEIDLDLAFKKSKSP
jgi:hypothetical protein